MQFTNSKSSNGSSNGSSKYTKGVYIDLITITKAENSDSEWNDCNIYIEGESPYAKYPKKFYLGGKHY